MGQAGLVREKTLQRSPSAAAQAPSRAAAERTPASALVSRIGSRAEEDGFITVDVLNSFCNAGCLVQDQGR